MDSRKRHIPISLPDDSLEAKKALWELLTMNEPVLSDVSSLDDESTDDESLLGKEHDAFCWKCHKSCKTGTKCTNCFIIYHEGCNPDHQKVGREWQCEECKTIAQNRDHALEMSVDMKSLLQCVMERINRKYDIQIPENYLENDLLVNPVTPSSISEKVESSAYANTDSFLLDFKWLVHNFSILAGQHDGNATELKAKKEAKRMLMKCIEDIDDIRNCCDCYLNQYRPDAVTMACSKPHLPLWVRFDEHPWWPAKLLKIGKDTTPLEVQFFGDFSRASVTYTDCQLYSYVDPNTWCGDIKREDFYDAIEEAKEYMKNVTQRFGPIELKPTSTNLIPGQLDNYLNEMIPGFRDASKRTSICQNEPTHDSPSTSTITYGSSNIASHSDQMNEQQDQPTLQSPTETEWSCNQANCYRVRIQNKSLKEQIERQTQVIDGLRKEKKDLVAERERLKEMLWTV